MLAAWTEVEVQVFESKKVVLSLLAVALLSACISTNVRQVERQAIDEICIQENPKVLMNGFLRNLLEEVNKRGIATRVYQEAVPEDCLYTMEYTANWNWDMTMYMSYARVELFKDGRPIGSAEYDGKMAGLDLSKFKTAESKVDPLIAEMLQNVE